MKLRQGQDAMGGQDLKGAGQTSVQVLHVGQAG